MLFGCCLNLLAKGNDFIGAEHIELIAKTGYNYIELPLSQVMRLSDYEFDALRRRMDHVGIGCRSCSNFFTGDSIPVTGPKVHEGKMITYIEKALNRARKLEANVVVFGSPASRNVVGDYPRDLATLQLVRALQLMGDCAAPDLQIAIEHVCHLEGNLIYTVKEGCLLQTVCRNPNVGVLADTYHMAIENEPIENLTLAKGRLLHVHIANPAGRVYPRPDDGVDYKKILHTLRDIGYTGGVSVEAFSKNPENDAPIALETLRRVLN